MPQVDADLLGRIDDVLERATSAGATGRVADEMASLVRLLSDEPRLRAVLGDAFVADDAKKAFVDDLFGDKLDAHTIELLNDLVARPRLSRNIRGAVEELAVLALIADADAQGNLDEVEDELFRFARVLRTERELRYALTDPTLPSEVRHAIVDDLLEGKAAAQTEALVRLVVDRSRVGDISARLYELAELAAQRRKRAIAEVRTAVDLDDARRRRLTEALTAATGREVEIKVLIDPEVIGGVVARVGDDVIDGSVRRNLQLALQTLTR